MFGMEFDRIRMSVPWNIFLLTLGGALYSLGLKAIAVPHGFISGGLFGVAMLIFQATGEYLPVSLSVWYTLVSIPVFALGWFYLSPRFFWYSLYGMFITTVTTEMITTVIEIQNPILAAVAGGSISGVGLTIITFSLGSSGGTTILGMILNKKYNMKIGSFSLAFNVVLFLVALLYMPADAVLYTMLMVYVYSGIIDHCEFVLNQRKLVFIISGKSEEMAGEILEDLGRGVTYLYTRGAYTNEERNMIMTIVYNYQLNSLEELVYRKDPDAFLVIENTASVMGHGFASRRQY